jgi:hypothetical protein
MRHFVPAARERRKEPIAKDIEKCAERCYLQRAV